MTAFDDNITFYDDIEAYPGSLSYRVGDQVQLHVSTRAPSYSVSVRREGPETVTVWERSGIAGVYHEVPDDADANGCRWPVGCEFTVSNDWRSGFYLVTLHADGAEADRAVAHAGFVVRPAARTADTLWVLATNTWNAYNNWGGRSLYTGGTQVSYRRPFGRGMLHRPETERDDRKARPARWGEEPDVDGAVFQRYRTERAYPPAVGSSGWHLFERRFCQWAEAEGFSFDYATSPDLDADPSVADGYRTIVSVGHDEYWSARQRAVVENHVERGGRLITLSGNTMFWQVRVEMVAETGEQTMVCWKYRAHTSDPIRNASPELTSGMWADPIVGRPEAALLGAGSAWGLYSRFGGATPKGSGAFTVYRPDHWVFADTGLRYGDLLGAKHGAVGYETVGCRIQFDEFQLPIRAGGDGTPTDLEIVAFTPASNCAVGEYPASISALSDQGDLEFIAERIHGDLSDESLLKARIGNSVLVVARPFGDDGGEVITVGTTDWVFGLPDDADVAQVTRNLLNR